MKVDIFIRSYEKDFKWLQYCLRSIKRYALGFNEVIIAYPKTEAKIDFLGFKTIQLEKTLENDYIEQQLDKLTAYKYVSKECTHILFVDSDCCFYDFFESKTYSENGKPVIQITDYNTISNNLCWKIFVEKFFNNAIKVDFEFMRCQPLLYEKQTLLDFQKWVIVNKNRTLHSICKEVKDKEFSEFNLLGVFIYYINRKENYSFVDTKIQTRRNPCKQYWSWGKMNKSIEVELNKFIYA